MRLLTTIIVTVCALTIAIAAGVIAALAFVAVDPPRPPAIVRESPGLLGDDAT